MPNGKKENYDDVPVFVRGEGGNKKVVKYKMDTLKKMIMSDSVYSIINAVASKSIDPKQLINIAYAGVTRNPKLLDCDPKSIVHCMAQAAEDGLILEGANQHAYAIPYGKIAVYQIGYKGLLHLLRKAIPNCRNIFTRLVYQNDFIEIEDGFSPKFVHRIDVKKERGNVIGAYAIIDIEGWTYPHYEYMSLDELNAVKEKALKKGGAVWRDAQAEPEMQRKTVLKRACKVMEMTPQMAEIINRDNRIESGAILYDNIDLPGFDVDFENVLDNEEPSKTETEKAPEQQSRPEVTAEVPAAESPIEKLNDKQRGQLEEITSILNKIAPPNKADRRKAKLLYWTDRACGKITDIAEHPELIAQVLDRAREDLEEWEIAQAAAAKAKSEGKIL